MRKWIAVKRGESPELFVFDGDCETMLALAKKWAEMLVEFGYNLIRSV